MKNSDSMEYSTGDIVKFKLESGEIQEGDVRFIERSRNEDILYISSFNRWDRVPENRIIAICKGIQSNEKQDSARLRTGVDNKR
ncbi:MAG: hypothetical protein WA144_00420 [Candidatus Methanoperedens sp.]